MALLVLLLVDIGSESLARVERDAPRYQANVDGVKTGTEKSGNSSASVITSYSIHYTKLYEIEPRCIGTVLCRMNSLIREIP